MPNEKMTILKMLEEGKITADEASRLLDSTSKAPAPAPVNRSQETYQRTDSATSGQNRSSTTGSFDDFTADLGRKFETFARDMEPKLQKFTEVFAEKTVNFADKISKTLESPRPAGGTPTVSAPAGGQPSYSGSGAQANFEMVVTSGYNELSIAGLNGETKLKGYNGDKITAKVFYKAKRGGASIELMKLGGKYYLNYDEELFERVSVDMFVPEGMFNVVNISNTNGTIDIASMTTDSFYATNANGGSRIGDIRAERIVIDSSNGKLDLNNIKGRSAEISNFNSDVEAGQLDIASLKLENGNGSVSIIAAYLDSYTDYMWAVETSNGKLTLNLPTLPDLGYHIKALTSLGNIKIGLTGLNYITNSSSSTEAKSIHYDSVTKKMKLSLETSNGGIHVN